MSYSEFEEIRVALGLTRDALMTEIGLTVAAGKQWARRGQVPNGSSIKLLRLMKWAADTGREDVLKQIREG